MIDSTRSSYDTILAYHADNIRAADMLVRRKTAMPRWTGAGTTLIAATSASTTNGTIVQISQHRGRS